MSWWSPTNRLFRATGKSISLLDCWLYSHMVNSSSLLLCFEFSVYLLDWWALSLSVDCGLWTKAGRRGKLCGKSITRNWVFQSELVMYGKIRSHVQYILKFSSLLFQFVDAEGIVNEDLPNSWECPECVKEGYNKEYKVSTVFVAEACAILCWLLVLHILIEGRVYTLPVYRVSKLQIYHLRLCTLTIILCLLVLYSAKWMDIWGHPITCFLSLAAQPRTKQPNVWCRKWHWNEDTTDIG